MRPRLSLPTNLVQSVVNALIDGLEVYFAMLTEHQIRVLRRFCKVQECRPWLLRRRDRTVPSCWRWGYRAILAQPTRAKITRLDRLARKWHGIINRVDIALDINCKDNPALRHWIVTHVILRWRKPGPMKEYRGTVYWENWKRKPKPRGRRKPTRCRRNLVLYSDKENRITGECDAVHLELRLM